MWAGFLAIFLPQAPKPWIICEPACLAPTTLSWELRAQPCLVRFSAPG